MNERIKQQVHIRRITRLCHFTPSRNLVHIATGSSGILSTRQLKSEEREMFTATDLARLDGHEGYICCSIEYPNAWYFEKARARDVLFHDWVILLIDPKYLWLDGTKFCPRNASAAYGRDVREGLDAFLSLYADSVVGSSNRSFHRSAQHLRACPTDEQAEVLIPDTVAIDDILGIVVPSEAQARDELSRFRLLGVPEDRFAFLIAPVLFDKRNLSDCIRSGHRPPEGRWQP